MKPVDINEIRDLWLVKYHGTTSEQVARDYPELANTPEWFNLFPCTQEQSDEWVKEAKALLRSKYKVPKHVLDRSWPYLYLDTAPYVKPLNEQ